VLEALATSKLAGLVIGWLLSAFNDWLARKRGEQTLRDLGVAQAAAQANAEASNAQSRMAASNAQPHTRDVALTGCNPAQVESVVVQCGHLAGMTKAQQAQAAAELRKLPPDSVIGNAIVPDWLRMRDEARACAQKAIGK
jgi:hypothetical protein